MVPVLNDGVDEAAGTAATCGHGGSGARREARAQAHDEGERGDAAFIPGGRWQEDGAAWRGRARGATAREEPGGGGPIRRRGARQGSPDLRELMLLIAGGDGWLNPLGFELLRGSREGGRSLGARAGGWRGDRAEEELHSSRTDARGRGRKLRWLVDGIWEDPEGDFGESGGRG